MLDRNSTNWGFDRQNNFTGGLINELKSSLTLIALQAEHQNKKNKVNIASIEKNARDSLQLIDNYLLCARSEYGQQLLPLEPVGPGAILYEVKDKLGSKSSIKSSYNEPVMVHKQALTIAIFSLAKLVINSDRKEDSKESLHIISAKRRGGEPYIGIFAKWFDIKQEEINRSTELIGKSQMSLSNQDFSSGIDLVIANQLANSMGGSLFVAKHKGKNGVALKLQKSEQLNLIS